MPSIFEVVVNYKRFAECRKRAELSMTGFVCGESKFRKVLLHRAWLIYYGKA